MAQETVRLARYAAGLRFEDIPAAIVGWAKECIAIRWRRSSVARPCRGAGSRCLQSVLAYRLERNQPQRVGCVGFQ